MHSAKRVILVPPDQTGGGGDDENTAIAADKGSVSVPVDKPVDKPMDRIKHKIFDKLHRSFKIILGLAETKSYDRNLRIKTKNGNYLMNSNILDLLTHAMSPGKYLYGEEDFVAALAASDIDPELLLNENVKVKLINYKNNIRPTNTLTQGKKVVRSLKPTKEIIVNDDNKEIPLVIPKPTNFKRKFSFTEDGVDDESDEGSGTGKRQRLLENSDSLSDDMIDKEEWQT